MVAVQQDREGSSEEEVVFAGALLLCEERDLGCSDSVMQDLRERREALRE